jgi:hypothetical protein
MPIECMRAGSPAQGRSCIAGPTLLAEQIEQGSHTTSPNTLSLESSTAARVRGGEQVVVHGLTVARCIRSATESTVTWFGADIKSTAERKAEILDYVLEDPSTSEPVAREIAGWTTRARRSGYGRGTVGVRSRGDPGYSGGDPGYCRGTVGVLSGYGRGTVGVRSGYGRGTVGVRSGYGRGTVGVRSVRAVSRPPCWPRRSGQPPRGPDPCRAVSVAHRASYGIVPISAQIAVDPHSLGVFGLK